MTRTHTGAADDGDHHDDDYDYDFSPQRTLPAIVGGNGAVKHPNWRHTDANADRFALNLGHSICRSSNQPMAEAVVQCFPAPFSSTMSSFARNHSTEAATIDCL